ncbi:DUF5064 family protein [Pseudomonas putida]|uniref:DUF5064 family protein n=1 Tax=Pseudomonas putida TaxID=303 RepID=UPI0023659E69|nr:DUF5064 family protein [Pseudomonas putida]MDD2050144.1 DUF5064 family protein [Pseudomonas putida]
MATFAPGQLHIERHALTKDDVSYDITLNYELFTDSKKGKGMQFTMHGSIQGKDLKETFFLPKEEAYNFASNVTKIAEKYGIPKHLSNIGSVHKHYDLMFEDIRVQLNMKSGDPIKPEHFE